MSLDQKSRRRYGRYDDSYDDPYDDRDEASPTRRKQRSGRNRRDSGNHYRQYAGLRTSPRSRARSRSRNGRSSSMASSSSADEAEDFRPPVVRRGQRKERAVYIKKRAILGVDIDSGEAMKPTSKPKKRKSFLPPHLDNLASIVARQGQHWAVEIGPWTIELGKDPETMKKPTVTVTHNDNLDPSWEKESDRIQVGWSTLSDAQLMHPERFIGGHPRNYSIMPLDEPKAQNGGERYRYSVPQYANCQLIASKIALFIADNPWEAFDKLNAQAVWRSSFLDSRQVYKYLRCLHPDPRNSLRCVARGLALSLREFLKADEADGEETLSRALSGSYGKFESTILSQLRYV